MAAEGADKISKPIPDRRQDPDEIRDPDKMCNHRAVRVRNKMRDQVLLGCKDVMIDRHVIQVSQTWVREAWVEAGWVKAAWDVAAWDVAA